MALSKEQFKQLRDQGLSVEQIIAFENGEKPAGPAAPEPKRRGFFGRVYDDLNKRAENVAEGYKAQFEGKQTPIETGIQLAGQGIGGAYDIAAEAAVTGGRFLSAVTPNFIENPVKDLVKGTGRKLLETEVGQGAIAGVQKFEELKETNPRLYRNLAAAGNIASVIPVAKGGQFGVKGIAKSGTVLEKAGTALERSGLEGIDKAKKEFVQDLIMPKETKKVLEDQVRRTREEGRGLFKRSIVEPTKREAQIAETVSQIPGVKKGNTFQQNFNAIQDAVVGEAENLKMMLELNDFKYKPKQFKKELKKGIKDLSEDPEIVGDAALTADRLINKFLSIASKESKTGSGLLEARKKYDSYVKSRKGERILDPKTENAFSVANDKIRQITNKFIDGRAPNANVKESLRKQSNMYDAMKNITPKAAEEANTAIGRFFQRSARMLGTRNKIVQASAAALGIGGLGAASFFAPIIAVGAGAGGAAVGTYKLLKNPTVRNQLGKLLKEVGDRAQALSPAERIELNKELQVINQVLQSDPDFIPLSLPSERGKGTFKRELTRRMNQMTNRSLSR